MKVWLDDERTPPDDSWTWVGSAQSAIFFLENDDVEVISLDHDLGDESIVGNGYKVISWIEEKTFTDDQYVPSEVILIHTQNSAARPRMQQSLNSIKNFAQRKK